MQTKKRPSNAGGARRWMLYTSRVVVLAAVLGFSACSQNSNCSSCMQSCPGFNPLRWICSLASKLITGCGEICSVRLELVDADSPETRLSNVAPGSSIDMTVTTGSSTLFDGTATVNSDGTIDIPITPCANLCDASVNTFAQFGVQIWGGSIKTNDPTCTQPGKKCRQWTVGSGATWGGINGCVPTFRLGMKKRATCTAC